MSDAHGQAFSLLAPGHPLLLPPATSCKLHLHTFGQRQSRWGTVSCGQCPGQAQGSSTTAPQHHTAPMPLSIQDHPHAVPPEPNRPALVLAWGGHQEPFRPPGPPWAESNSLQLFEGTLMTQLQDIARCMRVLTSCIDYR